MSHDALPTCPAEHRCDVLVIGCGPAGSTAATLLAFKAIYCLTSLTNLKRTIMAWRQHKLNIRTVENAEEAGCR
ncbi:FAD-dependent monooxygenase [Thiobacillus sp.]